MGRGLTQCQPGDRENWPGRTPRTEEGCLEVLGGEGSRDGRISGGYSSPRRHPVTGDGLGRDPLKLPGPRLSPGKGAGDSPAQTLRFIPLGKGPGEALVSQERWGKRFFIFNSFTCSQTDWCSLLPEK